MKIPNAIEVVTLFVGDIAAAKAFYKQVFAPEIVCEDDVSAVLAFSGAMVNLLAVSEAPPLVEPRPVAPSAAGVGMLLTIRVASVDTAVKDLEAAGVTLLNGPIDRPWGRRTAAFADPSGYVWEIAEEIG